MSVKPRLEVKGCERITQFLHRRRACFLQMIGADIHRIPFRHLARREQDGVLDEPHRRRGRKDVGPAREIFLHDVVLRGALEIGARRALLVAGLFLWPRAAASA